MPKRKSRLAPASPAFVPPYAASWFDRVMAVIDRLPGPYPVWYAAYALGGFALITLWRAAAGLPAFGGDLPQRIYGSLMFGVPPLLVHYLNRTASNTFAAFRPALRSPEIAPAIAYRLTTAPARPSLLFSLGGAAFAVLMVVGAPAEMRSYTAGIYGPPLAALVFGAAAWFVNSHFAYRLIYQLMQVSRIYTHHALVRLADLRPHFALSRFTSRAAIASILVTTGYLIGFLQVGSQSLTVMVLVPNLLLAVSAFVLPLSGAHRSLESELGRAVGEAGQHLESALMDLHAVIASRDYRSAPAVKDAVTALDIELNRLARIPTWPWSPGTLRGVLAAVFLPVFIWLIQYGLQRWLG